MQFILEGNPICLSALENGLGKDLKHQCMPMILCKWEKLIAALNPVNQELQSLSEECIQNLIDQSEEEQEIVKTCLIEGIIDRPKIMDKRQ